LLLLFGEITPKNLAKNRAETVALKVIVPVFELTRATFPVVRALRAISSGMVRPFGAQLLSREGTPLSEDQLVTFIEVMVPRTEMQAIEVDTPLDEVLQFVVEDGHSRYPVYKEVRDNVILPVPGVQGGPR